MTKSRTYLHVLLACRGPIICFISVILSSPFALEAPSTRDGFDLRDWVVCIRNSIAYKVKRDHMWERDGPGRSDVWERVK